MFSRTRSRLFTWKLWLEGRQELSGILLWKTGMPRQGARQLGLWGNKKVVLTEARSVWQRSAALWLDKALYALLLHYDMPGAYKAFWDRCNCGEVTTTDSTQANGLDRVNRGLSPEKEREMQNWKYTQPALNSSTKQAAHIKQTKGTLLFLSVSLRLSE